MKEEHGLKEETVRVRARARKWREITHVLLGPQNQTRAQKKGRLDSHFLHIIYSIFAVYHYPLRMRTIPKDFSFTPLFFMLSNVVDFKGAPRQ